MTLSSLPPRMTRRSQDNFGSVQRGQRRLSRLRTLGYYILPLEVTSRSVRLANGSVLIVAPEIEAAVVALAIEQPTWGQVRASNELKKQGLSISPFGVPAVWLRHDLANTSTRLKALEARMAQEGFVLTEAQVVALEKAKTEKERRVRERMSRLLRRPGHFLCRQHEGRRPHLSACIYPQTFIDTYTKVVFAKLYYRKTPITAAEILNDRVLPFFEEHGIVLCRVLTDRGTEYCGNPEHHDYELYLAVEDIDHTRTKTRARRPMESASASTRPCSTSSIVSPSARRCIVRLTSCRRISMPGSTNTMRCGRIRDAGASAKPRSRHSWTLCR